MDVKWSKLVKLDHPWYQGVTLFTTSRGAEHNTKSHQGLSFVLRRGDRIAFSLFCVFSVKKKKKSVFFGKTAKNTKLCKMTKITAFY